MRNVPSFGESGPLPGAIVDFEPNRSERRSVSPINLFKESTEST